MISDADLIYLENWFKEYTNSFKNTVSDWQGAIDLKYEHSIRVSDEIVKIGESLNISDADLKIAKISALFHDIGRFEQYAIYKTFADNRSENHGLLGISILKKMKILENISDKDLIMTAIENHNKKMISPNLSAREQMFCKILRDADKIDIYKVVTDYYQQDNNGKNSTIELELADSPDISEAVYKSITNYNTVCYSDLKTLSDFKVLQLSWIFDVNFEHTINTIIERKYLNIIKGSLPNSNGVKEIFLVIKSFLK